MKPVMLWVSLLLAAFQGFGQEYSFYVYLTHSNLAPVFKESKGEYFYSGKDSELKDFFSDFVITGYERVCPACDWESAARVYRISSTSGVLARRMVEHFPSLFEFYEDCTDEKYELTYFPNDYGSTSPVPNVGVAARPDLDYINVEKAWDYTTGIGVMIGISDARINDRDTDFANKISFINPSPYQSVGYSSTDIQTYHGTQSAAIAAAQGDNAHNSTGICYDCEIIGTQYSSYNNLVLLAQAGVRVINMSWTSLQSSPVGYVVNQDIIDNLINNYGVVLVASAGNQTSYQTSTDWVCDNGTSSGPSTTGMKYGFPASYEGVISVSGVYHEYDWTTPVSTSDPIYCCTSPTMPVYIKMKDVFSQCVDGTDPNDPLGINFNGYPQYCNIGMPSQYLASPAGIVYNLTTNPSVDVLAPCHNVLSQWIMIEENTIVYSYGQTSSAAPVVTGVAALMVSEHPCITPGEVEDIIMLTSNDVPSLPVNRIYDGVIGAGRVDAGDAVEFTHNMKSSTGNAVIQNHYFPRFTFILPRINGMLTLDNLAFSFKNISEFTARVAIDVTSTDFSPDADGYIDLKIDEELEACPSLSPKEIVSDNEVKEINVKESSVLYPNPNSGDFSIVAGGAHRNLISFEIFDLLGKCIFSDKQTEKLKSFTLPIIPAGIYLAKISSENETETIKFVKR